LQMHPPANVAVLQHRTTPGRSVNVHQHRLGTKSRMPVQQRIALSATHERIYAILSLDFDNCSFWQAVHRDSTFDLRLNDVVVDLVTQVRIGSEYLRDEIDRFCHSCLYHNRSPKRQKPKAPAVPKGEFNLRACQAAHDLSSLVRLISSISC